MLPQYPKFKHLMITYVLLSQAGEQREENQLFVDYTYMLTHIKQQ